MRKRPLDVDERLSWALRADEEVRVSLRIPGAVLTPGQTGVRLSSTRGNIKVPADAETEADAGTVSFSVAQAKLGRAAWHVAIQPSSGAPYVATRARLLAPIGAPVALLSGPAPATRMPAPAPRVRQVRPSAARRAAGHLPGPVRRALRVGRDAGRRAARRLRAGS